MNFLKIKKDKALECQREISTSPLAQLIKFVLQKESYLLTYYLFTKILFIGNVFGQLYVLNSFLGDNYNLFAIDVVINLFNSNQDITSTRLSESERFPRVTMCHFQVIDGVKLLTIKKHSSINS